MVVNNEAKVKAVLAVSLFLISMVIVGSLAFEAGKQVGYDDGYSQANQDWTDFLNANLGPFIDYVYQEGYNTGFRDGFLYGFVDAWLEYGDGESFRHPDGGIVP